MKHSFVGGGYLKRKIKTFLFNLMLIYLIYFLLFNPISTLLFGSAVSLLKKTRVKGEMVKLPPQFSGEVLVQFTSNLVSILPTISTSKINQNGTLGHVTFLMTSSYFVKFSEILMKFQFEITFDVKNYFLLLLRFLKENLLEIGNK